MRPLFRFMEGTLHSVHRQLNPGYWCTLDLPLGNTGVISGTDDTLVTAFELVGNSRFVAATEHQSNTKSLSLTLQSLFESRRTDLMFVFEADNDKDSIEEDLRKGLQDNMNSAAQLQMDCEALYDEQIDILSRSLQHEKCWLILWTNNRGIGGKDSALPDDLKELPHAAESQSMAGFRTHHLLVNHHEATIETLITGFGKCCQHLRLLSNTEWMRDLRMSINPHYTGAYFTPKLFGEAHSAYHTPDTLDYRRNDPSLVMPEKLGKQMWVQQPEYDSGDDSILHIGERSYRSFMFSQPPHGELPFDHIIQNCHAKRIPFRFSMLLKGDAIGITTVKYVVANILTVLPFSGANEIRKELAHMRNWAAQKPGEVCGMQMMVATWSDNRDLKLLRQRSVHLSQIVTNWQGSQVKLCNADVLPAFLSTLPGYSHGSVAPAAIPAVNDALWYAPITRPVSLSASGGMLMSSGDGKLIRFQPLDPELMEHHVYLITGEPGFGKSLLCNVMLWVLSSSHDRLPYIAISDVGPSSKGLIKMLKAQLPQHLKHMVQYRRQQNLESESINPCDTPPCLRTPFKEQIAELQNLFMLLLRDDATGSIPDGISGLLNKAIPLMYRNKSDLVDQGAPALFRKTAMADKFWPVIEEALSKIEFRYDADTSWWEIVEALMEAGESRASVLAQRFAVPRFQDLANVMLDEELRTSYPDEVATNLTMPQWVQRRVGEVLEAYPVLQRETQVELGEARIVAFDLEQVCPRSADHAYSMKKQAAVFYNITSGFLTKRFFWNVELLKQIPAKYHEFYRRMIADIRETPNLYFADEQQRFCKIDEANQQNIQITREGRKLKVGVALASQGVVEFPDELIKMSTGQFVLGFGEKNIDDIEDAFRLTPTESYLIKNRIPRPGKRGSFFLMRLQKTLKYGDVSLLANLKVGPQMLWGLSTHADDERVRSSVEQRFGEEPARRYLSRLHPSGSVLAELEQRKLLRITEANQMLVNIDAPDGSKSVLGEIIEDSIQKIENYYREEVTA